MILDEIVADVLPKRRARTVKRGVRRKQSKYPVRHRDDRSKPSLATHIILM